MKKWRVLLISVFMMAMFWIVGGEVQAEERHSIGKVTITESSGVTKSSDICVVTDEWGGITFELEEGYFQFFCQSEQESMSFQVNVTIEENEYFTLTSAIYEETIVLQRGDSSLEWIELTVDNGYGQEVHTFYYNIQASLVDMEIESLVTSASKKGFHPSKGNYLIIRSYVYAYVNVMSEYSVCLDVRIHDSKGKDVYKKTYENAEYGGYLNFNWNGKDSKSKTYVKDGTYTVELTYRFEGAGEKREVKKTVKFKVSRKAPKGKKGLAKAKNIVTLTGNPEIDYMAERMVKAAGVKMNMSDEQKVKKIYHYMTKKFKHTHYTESNKKYKVYYKFNKLAKKIEKYRKKTDKQLAQGKLVYNYQYSYINSWCMQRRRGVCDDHAEIFQILLNHVGVDTGVCRGYYLNRDGSEMWHVWNYALVDGKKYYYDVDVEIQNYGKGQGDYYWYRKTKKQAKKNHKLEYET